MRQGEAAATIDAFGLDAVCSAVSSGTALYRIAEQIGVAEGSLWNWIHASPERSARVRTARANTAAMWDEKAEQVLWEAPDQLGIMKARELASHYRWRASKIAPQHYGDRQQTQQLGKDGQPVDPSQVVPVINVTVAKGE